MAKWNIDIDTKSVQQAMRDAMVEAICDVVDTSPQYRMAVILALLLRDGCTRMMLAEAIGEEGLRQTRLDTEHQERVDLALINKQLQTQEDADYRELCWQEIAVNMIRELQDTPGGRGEAL